MRLIPLILAAALLLLSVTLWPDSDGGSLLAWINIAIMLTLSLLLTQYGIKLLRQRRSEPPPGSRLRAKLVIGLVAMLLVPSMTIQIAANQMVERGMEVWFDVRVDTLLDRALTLAQGFYDRVEKDMKRDMLDYISDGTLIAAASGRLDYRTASNYLNSISETEGWQKAELFNINELPVGSAQRGELATVLQAEPLSEAARLSMRLGRISTEVTTRGDEEVALGYAPIIGATSVIGLLRAEVRLPAGIIQNARAVEADYQSYRQLEHNRQNIGTTFTHVMLFVTLLVVLIAGMVGLLFARSLTTPIGTLASALKRITKGDLDVVIPESSRDELGSLAQSFNTMASHLKENDEAIAQAQKDLTKALDNSRQRQYVLETLLANLQSGVLLVDSSGLVRLLNQSVRDILQLPENWTPGIDILKKSQGKLHNIGEFYAEISQQQDDYLQREFDIELSEGARCHLLVRGARLKASDSSGFSGYLLVIDDISELAEAQRNKAWSEVAQRLAHEIKNPLTPIKLSAERLQRRFRSQVDDEQTFDVCTHAVISQVERLQRLIEDFSTLARMPQPKVRKTPVNALLQEMQELFNSYHRLEVTCCDTAWHCICDPDQVRQVLINLVDNALTVTEEQSDKSVRVYASMSEKHVEWHVEDDGTGISEDAVPQLFEAYYSTKESGSGLGLAIAKRIAEDHGGTLSLVSPAAPTHFCLQLPREPEEVEAS